MEAMLTTKLRTHNLAFPMLDFGKTEAGPQHACARNHRRANACVLT